MSEPAHGKEHNDVATLVAKTVNMYDDKIAHFVLVTIGHDGRPLVSSSIGPGQIQGVFEFMAKAHDHIESVTAVPIAGNN